MEFRLGALITLNRGITGDDCRNRRKSIQRSTSVGSIRAIRV